LNDSKILLLIGIGTATSQLSQINSVSAQSGASHKAVDEFDMLAQSRNTTVDGKVNIKETTSNKPSGVAVSFEKQNYFGCFLSIYKNMVWFICVSK
jgi:hypothetical protein